MLGPTIFSDYSSPVAALIRFHGISVQCYADDTYTYRSIHARKCKHWTDFEKCIEDLRYWMNRNRLKLNDNKTEFIIFGTHHKLQELKTQSIKVGEENILAVKEVRNIGAFFDSEMKMEVQVKNMCRSAWINLYNISKIRKYLTVEQTKTIVHAFVTSKLDANNSLLTCLINTESSVLRLQLERVQNAAAKLIKQKRKFDRASPILQDLHWLPIKDTILFKLLLLVYKALNQAGPLYLRDLFILYKPPPGNCSAKDPLQLVVPKPNLVSYRANAFSVRVAYEWNRLPLAIRSAKSTNAFKAQLKTRLF